jgi:drug/metabolite transporter (DMT)-like permease
MRIAARPVAGREVMLGVLILMGALLVFASMDALAKHLTASHSVTQVLWARYAFSLVLLLPLLALPRLRRAMATQRPGLQALRGVLLAASGWLIITAFARMPLADATAITFVSPMLVMALSAILLHERVDWQRWLAAAIGFGGILCIARPGGGGYGWIALLPLASALGWAGALVSTRRLSLVDSTLATLFYGILVGTVLMSILVLQAWTAPSSEGWLLLVLLGALGVLGHTLLILAFTQAPASVVAPFTYTQIVWATLFGVIFFNNAPDLMTIVGTAIIIGTGLYILWREARSRRDAPH